MEINEKDDKEITDVTYDLMFDKEFIDKPVQDNNDEISNMNQITNLEIDVIKDTDEHEEGMKMIEMKQINLEIDDKNIDIKNINLNIKGETKVTNIEEIEEILNLANRDKIVKEHSSQRSIQESVENVYPLSQKMVVETIHLKTLVRIFQIILCLFIATPLDAADLFTSQH